MERTGDKAELLIRAVRPTNAYEESMQRLLQSIRLGVIPPGHQLPPERDLARMLKVSRDTVREALSTLSDAGYVTSRRGRYGGTFVVDELPQGPLTDTAAVVTADEVEDVTVLRRALEIGAAREAAARDLTSVERSSLAHALDACATCPPEDHRRLDSRLHLLIAELSGSPSLVPLAANTRSRVNALLEAIPVLEPNIVHSSEQHS